MTTVSAKFTKNEIDYLESIARKNSLFKGDSTEPSVGKAMKELVKWCHMTGMKIGGTQGAQSNDSEHMLEQIHTAIPHLMYMLRLQLLCNTDSLSDEKIATSKQSALNYINASCGEFQNISYQTISPIEDDMGMCKLPVDKNSSKWILKKI